MQRGAHMMVGVGQVEGTWWYFAGGVGDEGCNPCYRWCGGIHFASCRELEMGEMIYIFPLPAEGFNDSLNSPPHSFSYVRMSPRPFIKERDQMVESAVHVAVGFQILVCRPAVTNDCSAGYHSGTNDSHQGVTGCPEWARGRSFWTPTLPSTHCPVTACPFWYLRWPNLLSSMSTILLGPPIFTE